MQQLPTQGPAYALISHRQTGEALEQDRVRTDGEVHGGTREVDRLLQSEHAVRVRRLVLVGDPRGPPHRAQRRRRDHRDRIGRGTDPEEADL